MTATEWWLLAAAIAAGLGALAHLIPEPRKPVGLAPALVAVGLVLLAVALAVSPL